MKRGDTSESDIGQTDVSKMQDWDAASLTENSSRILANSRRHSLRVRGQYQIAPEWMATGMLLAQSGSPKSYMGYYGTDEDDPVSYGKPSNPCALGNNPWTLRVDLGLNYRPAFAKDRLGFSVDVINALKRREATQTQIGYEDDRYTVANEFGMGTFFQQPRYLRFGVSYDF